MTDCHQCHRTSSLGYQPLLQYFQAHEFGIQLLNTKKYNLIKQSDVRFNKIRSDKIEGDQPIPDDNRCVYIILISLYANENVKIATVPLN